VRGLLRAERLAERLRLLYVALTRAVHRCHLVVGVYQVGRAAHPTAREACAAPLNWLVAGRGSADDWCTSPPAAGEIAQAWAQLAARAPQAIALSPLPDAAARPLAPAHPPPDAVAALPPPARPPARWRIGSFSSLTQGVRHEAAAIDHDQHAAAGAVGGLAGVAPTGDMGDSGDIDARRRAGAPGIADRPAPAADDIARFPRGPAAGDCLHAVFEHADFADPATWPGAIDTALRDAGALAADERWRVQAPAQLRRMLDDVLSTPLRPGLQLRAVPPARRLVELEFHLPAAALDTRALAAVMARHGLPVPAFSASMLRGWLHGFIDLVFEHAGRWHVLDWKSNHLGDTAADYGPTALAAEMARHAYPLQGLLYAVALHRLLRLRLDGYRPEQHLGEVLYLFVRGVRPGWRDAASGRPCGVWALQPSPALLDEVSALLQPAGEPPA
jgi:exodeoxyribonuclease V beta subunit